MDAKIISVIISLILMNILLVTFMILGWTHNASRLYNATHIFTSADSDYDTYTWISCLALLLFIDIIVLVIGITVGCCCLYARYGIPR